MGAHHIRGCTRKHCHFELGVGNAQKEGHQDQASVQAQGQTKYAWRLTNSGHPLRQNIKSCCTVVLCAIGTGSEHFELMVNETGGFCPRLATQADITHNNYMKLPKFLRQYMVMERHMSSR